MLWRELVWRPDFEAAKVIICPMLKLQMELGFKQKMAFNTKGAKRDSIRKLCPLNRMVLRSLAKNRTIFDSKSFWSLTTISWLSFFSHQEELRLFVKEEWGQKIDLSLGVDRVVKCTRKLEFTLLLNIFMAFDKDDRLESQEDCSTLLSSSSRFSVAALTTQFPVPRTNLDQFYSADAVSGTMMAAAKRDDSFRLTSATLCKFANTLEKICTPFYHICRKAPIAWKGFKILSYLIWH